MEHRFTVPPIGDLLEAAGLEFRGFERPGIVRSQFWTRYPKPEERRDLARWHQFELEHPDAFGNLYEIWAKKP